MFIAGFPAGSLRANCYLVAAETGGDCVVVDPGQDALPSLESMLARHGLRPVAVLLTHGHLDHVASAAAVCRATEIPAYIHAQDAYMLDDPGAALTPQLRAALAGLPLDGLRPDELRTLDAATDLELAGFTVHVVPTPGHTGGSVTYRLDGDDERPEVLLTGDTLFAGSIGRTDLPGGSTETLLASIAEQLLTRPDDTAVLSGHGPTSTIGAERVTNPFLARV